VIKFGLVSLWVAFFLSAVDFRLTIIGVGIFSSTLPSLCPCIWLFLAALGVAPFFASFQWLASAISFFPPLFFFACSWSCLGSFPLNFSPGVGALVVWGLVACPSLGRVLLGVLSLVSFFGTSDFYSLRFRNFPPKLPHSRVHLETGPHGRNLSVE